MSIVGFLVFIHIALQSIAGYTGHDTLWGLIHAFDLDSENNIPSFFSALLLIFAAVLLGSIAFTKKEAAKDFYHRLGLSFLFAFLSMDEWFMIHEKTPQLMAQFTQAENLPSYLWMIPYGLFALLIMFLYLKFIKQLPIKTRSLFLISGILYVAGAIGLEGVNALLVHLNSNHFALYDTIAYTCEESMEMTAVVIFIRALLDYKTKIIPTA